ncbi:autoinducer binding domain-containing protein [Niveispirillum fermenti]|uniref:autoinducer binding domain-containing protein n=1 Tax=Niveispirillum fermenti TaxID=1233113 RepID=UPI003A89C9DA
MSPLLPAIEAFRAAGSSDGLWQALHAHLGRLGITGILYGTEALPGPGREANFILNSIGHEWLGDKFAHELFYCDEYVRVARIDPTPVLWDAIDNLHDIDDAARRSLALDYDYGIITGVTVPMRFCDGLGGSSIGCHAAGLSLAGFAHLWRQQGTAITTIVNAFDATLRTGFAAQMFGLSVQEKSCLEYLASGLLIKQVADRMRCTERQMRAIATRARGKLKSLTQEQAVATALVYGLIDP